VVNKIITDLGEFEFRPDGLTLIALAPGVTVDEVKKRTEASFKVALDEARAA
jgi:3-oxoacid CoA-transferase subunit B